MRRLHAIAISILLGAGIAAGAAASLRTVHLGAAAAATQTTVSKETVVARRAKLAAWSASLRKARAARPPALPRVPHYAPVPIPTMPPIRQAAETQTTVVRHVAESPDPAAPASPSPPTTPVAPAEPQVTYVQPPPIVQYEQAPAPATTPTTAAGENEGYDDDHAESSGHEHDWSSGDSADGHEADD